MRRLNRAILQLYGCCNITDSHISLSNEARAGIYGLFLNSRD